MRPFLSTMTTLTLLAAAGFLAADVLFDISTPFGRPSLLIMTGALAIMTWQLRKTYDKLFRRAINSYIQHEELREMEVELKKNRDELGQFQNADTQPVTVIAP
ncbi:hypothetical protein OAK91_00970 [Planctomycetaceae bacterium]|jgi:hypothetical protein|nr:hypothetical protein [Planctomycetaceae bacterium]